MKKILCLSIILSIFSTSLVFSDNSTLLQEFYGGYLNLKFSFYTDSFYGSRGDALRMAGAMSTLDFHPSFSSYNPSCLAYQDTPYASMSLIPAALPISTAYGNQINDAVSKAENSALKNNLAPGGIQQDSNLEYQSAGQASGIMDFELVHPFAKSNISIAVSREEKFDFELNMLLSGVEALVAVNNQNPLYDMSMRAQVNALLNLDIRTIVTSVGLGRRVTPEWGVGAVVEHFESTVQGNGNAQIDAMGTICGVTQEFNTDSHNTLAQQAAANLYTEAWGLRLGTAYHFLNGLLELGGDVAIEPELKYNGSIDAQGHWLPKTINLADFTATQLNSIDTSGQLTMKLPSFIRFSFAWRPGMALDINYIHYFDGFSMTFRYPDYQAYLRMLDSVRLGFNFEKFQLGFGVILAEEQAIMKDATQPTGVKESHQWIPVPLLSTGIDIPMGRYINTEIELAGVPTPFLKSTITFNF